MYSFSLTTFFVGLLIFIAGGSLILWHRWIGDNFVYGVSSYDKIKFWGCDWMHFGIFCDVELTHCFLGIFRKNVV